MQARFFLHPSTAELPLRSPAQLSTYISFNPLVSNVIDQVFTQYSSYLLQIYVFYT